MPRTKKKMPKGKTVLDLPFHPLAEQYPLLAGEAREEFEADVKARGFLDPIWVWKTKEDGKPKTYLIDGRNRVLVGRKLKIEPKVRSYTGPEDELEAFIASLNIHRRHLTPEFVSERRQERIARAAALKHEGKSLRAIAEEMNVSQTQVRRDLEAARAPGAPSPGAPGANHDSEKSENAETGQETPGAPGGGAPGGNGTVTGLDGKQYPATKPAPVLCERCKKGPAVKSCSMCRELRLAGKAKGETKTNGKSARADEDAPVDCFRHPVPKRCRDVLFDPWVQETIDTLAEVSERVRKARIMDGMNKRAKRLPHFNAKDVIDGVGFVIQYLDSVLSHLKDHRPAAICPCCEDGKGCADCHMTGLVSRKDYPDLKKKTKETASV